MRHSIFLSGLSVGARIRAAAGGQAMAGVGVSTDGNCLELTISFSDWPKVHSEFSKSAPVTSSSCRLYNNHVKGTQVHRQSCHV